MIWLQIGLGLVLLLAGGEFLVRGAVGVATRLGISKMVIGLTLVGFGTSTPELVASVNAALAGSPGIAVGNVVGSNIANILLILGVAALIMPLVARPEAFRRDGAVLVATALLLTVICLLGALNRPVGAVLVVLLAAYTWWSYWLDRRNGQTAAVHAAEADEVAPVAASMGLGIAYTLGGLVGVIVGADLLVGGAIEVARLAGLSETLIGLTLVAVGTSLPELVTSVMAALRRHTDVAFGNIIGSNIYNILGILGVTALVSPIDIPPEIVDFDIWAMGFATLLLVVFTVTGWRLQRWEGAVFLVLYGLYVAVQLLPGVRSAVGLA